MVSKAAVGGRVCVWAAGGGAQEVARDTGYIDETIYIYGA